MKTLSTVMRISLFILLTFTTFAAMVTVPSCSVCDTVECAPPYRLTGQFRILNKSDGKDLLFGTSKKYDPSSIRFFTIKGADSLTLVSRAILYALTSPTDSVLEVHFNADTKTAYIRLPDGDIDTLILNHVTERGGKCCPGSSGISSITWNDSLVLSAYGAQSILK